MKKSKPEITENSEPNEQLVPTDEVNMDNFPAEVPNFEWLELTSLGAIEELIAEGWTPRVKTKTGTGLKTICLRRISRDDDGKRHDSERGLGLYSDERWAKLLSYYPKVEVPTTVVKESKASKGSPILSTLVSKPTPLQSSIHLDLSTLQWYVWAQQKAGYPGTLEQFINQCVDGYFHEYHKLELAVISEK
jgi:hypothetical protein